MTQTFETYVAFWKTKIERVKDFNKVYERTGIVTPSLLKNYWPFEVFKNIDNN